MKKAIEDIVKGEENNVDGKNEDIFRDDNEVFENDDMIDKLIKQIFSHKTMKRMKTLTLLLKKLM